MGFKSINAYLFEKEQIKYIDVTITDPMCHGHLKYREYADGIIVDIGGYVDKEYRSSGVFKCIFEDFLSRMKPGNVVYLVLTNPILTKYLKEQGFESTEETVRYWGKPENAIIYKKVF
jgi:hypothetical protein